MLATEDPTLRLGGVRDAHNGVKGLYLKKYSLFCPPCRYDKQHFQKIVLKVLLYLKFVIKPIKCQILGPDPVLSFSISHPPLKVQR